MTKPEYTTITLPDPTPQNPDDITFVSVTEFKKLEERYKDLAGKMLHMDAEIICLKQLLVEDNAVEAYEEFLELVKEKLLEGIENKNGKE